MKRKTRKKDQPKLVEVEFKNRKDHVIYTKNILPLLLTDENVLHILDIEKDVLIK